MRRYDRSNRFRKALKPAQLILGTFASRYPTPKPLHPYTILNLFAAVDLIEMITESGGRMGGGLVSRPNHAFEVSTTTHRLLFGGSSTRLLQCTRRANLLILLLRCFQSPRKLAANWKYWLGRHLSLSMSHKQRSIIRRLLHPGELSQSSGCATCIH
jgi:hypothetical protein